MAAHAGKSVLFAKHRDKVVKAHETHKNDDVEYNSFSEIPPGIENGIAQLIDCKIDTFKTGDLKGELYFSMTGVVMEPAEFNGDKVLGRQFRQMPEPLCDTPKRRSRKTFDDHMAYMYNELGKMGVERAGIDPRNIEATLEALKSTKPFFKFRSWKGTPNEEFPNPRTTVDWMGVTDYTPTGEAGDATEDDSDPAPEPDEPKVSKVVKDKKGKPAKEEPKEDFDEFGDLDTLIAQATDQDDEAMEKLTKMAMERGYTEEDVEEAEDWNAVAAMITGGKGDDSSQEEGDGEEDEDKDGNSDPEVGDVCRFNPIDPKTKKPGKKSVEVEVTAVNAKKKTVTLKNVSSPKITYDGVKWDDLQRD